MNRFVVLTTHHEPIGRGRIIHGDGAVYQKVRFKAVVFTIEDLEVFEGAVSDMIRSVHSSASDPWRPCSTNRRSWTRWSI